ncbi:MAG: hypothetical protein AB1641_19375 [Thermodesulfobacteriota bacterium]
MTPAVVFVVRAVLSVVMSVIITWIFYDRLNWLVVGLLAAFMILVSYLFEAWRARRDKLRPLK